MKTADLRLLIDHNVHSGHFSVFQNDQLRIRSLR